MCRTSHRRSICLHSRKMDDAPRLLKIPKSECPGVWKRLPRHEWLKTWAYIADPVVPLERKLYGHRLAGLLWERQFEVILLGLGWENVPNWGCLFVHRKQGLFLSENVDLIKMTERQQNTAPMWKKLMELVDLDKPTSYLECTQRECKPNEDIVNRKKKCSNHECLLGATLKLPEWQKPHAKTVAWSYDMEGHAKKCVERCCELANKRQSNCTQF